MTLLYPARVMRLDPGGPVVRVPLLGRDALWGPVLSTVGGLEVDEQVIVGQLGSSRDQLIILGRLAPEAIGGGTRARLDRIDEVLSADDVRMTSVESRLTRLVEADHATGIDLDELRSRLGTIENAATALPAVTATVTDTSADVAQLKTDMATQQDTTATLRTDLNAARADITGLRTDLNALSLRVGALESWKASGGGSGGTAAPTKPGGLLSLPRWELTLPVGSGTGNPDDIYAGGTPDLVTFSDANWFRLGSDSNGYYVEFAAQVNGTGPDGRTIVTTSSASGASRSELREMATANGGSSGAKAAWTPTDSIAHSLTVTMSCDPTGITGGRQELIIGQIHGASGTPPLYLACNFNTTKKLTLFRNGASASGGDILSGQVDVGTVFTYRMAKTAANRVQFSYALGGVSALPATPQFDWAGASDFTDVTAWYYKVGSYNKTQIDAAGASGIGKVRVYAMTLV